MKSKIIFFITFAIIIFFSVALYNCFFGSWLDVNVSIKKEILKSELGDEFIIQFETSHFPDVDTTVTILDSIRKEVIADTVISGEIKNEELSVIYHSSQIKCYQIYGMIIYQVNNEKFEGISIGSIDISNSKENPNLVIIAKALVSLKEWKWVKAFGSFLIKSGDMDTEKILEKYALSQFTQEELDLNKHSEIKKEEITNFSKSVLDKRNK